MFGLLKRSKPKFFYFLAVFPGVISSQAGITIHPVVNPTVHVTSSSTVVKTLGFLAPFNWSEPVLGTQQGISSVNLAFTEERGAFTFPYPVRKVILPDLGSLDFSAIFGNPLSIGVGVVGGYEQHELTYLSQSAGTIFGPNLSLGSVGANSLGAELTFVMGERFFTDIPFPKPTLDIIISSGSAYIIAFSGTPYTEWDLESTGQLSSSTVWDPVGSTFLLDTSGGANAGPFPFTGTKIFYRATFRPPSP